MVIEFIKKKREEYPMLGQEPIWYELRDYCKRMRIKCPSVSTVARIIRYLKDIGAIYDKRLKVSFYARSG